MKKLPSFSGFISFLYLWICRKPKNQRVKRALEAREPKAVENPRSCVCLRGNKTSEVVTTLLKDLVRTCQLIFYALCVFVCQFSVENLEVSD